MLDQEGLRFRAALFRFIREFFEGQGFLEVDTPIRQKVIIPEANIIPLMSEDHFLQTSPELYMKRLLAAGNDKIFQICHCFRKDERGRNHLEEFTMLEWYRLDADYYSLMEDCEELIGFILRKLMRFKRHNDYSETSPLLDGAITIDKPWTRLSVQKAFDEFCPVSMEKALENDLFDEMLVKYIEPQLGKGVPLFLYDYPIELGSLAKAKENSPDVAERFELYINGMELANGFSELTDPDLQRQRFENELISLREQGHSLHKMPEQFLEELGKIDEAAGIALGLDRLFMLCSGIVEIDSAVVFSPGDTR